MGGGSERAALLEQVDRLKLSNVAVLPYQPYSIMPEAYATADTSFVSQARGTSNDGIPSKVYQIMASARPVIASTDPYSDLANLVERAGGGIVVNPGDPFSLANAIEQIYPSLFFGDRPAFTVEQVVAIESACDLLLGCRAGQQIASKLPNRELVERQIVV